MGGLSMGLGVKGQAKEILASGLHNNSLSLAPKGGLQNNPLSPQTFFQQTQYLK